MVHNRRVEYAHNAYYNNTQLLV